MAKNSLISPYGGELVDLLVPAEERRELFEFASKLPSVQLTRRETCDLELLATGGFSPLRSFMGRSDLERVGGDMRLADGSVFPIPVTFSVDNLDGIAVGTPIALRDQKNELLAILDVEEIFEWDHRELAASVFGTDDPRHPLVTESARWGRFCLSGRLRVLSLPVYHDFKELRMTPAQTRARLEDLGRENVVAFQTRNPIHFAHEVMTQRAIELADGTLLLHPVVGLTKEGDIDHYTRVRTYRIVRDLAYEPGRALLALLPLAMRMAGPREAVWHAIIRRNYGANFLIVGRDHASPGLNSKGEPFYAPTAAQELVVAFSDEIGVTPLTFGEFAYLPDDARYEETVKVSKGVRKFSLSGTEIRDEYLSRGRALPNWFTRPEVSEVLAESHPPRNRQGVCIWFTGLSASGKSTTAEVLVSLLLEEGRQSTLLDGDVVRTHLSKGLGFSREDRETNVTRIGFVASEVVRHGGVAICAAVSPYRSGRDRVRQMFPEGKFIEVFVDTPLAVCEDRDPKGMYAKARRGEIKDFTGINDAYEPPENPELRLETVSLTAADNAAKIISQLRTLGFVA
ncbi:MAG: bifunctional sulfate adenylyltransferase/adenylylsulfate kinase [Chloracidobacterium sp.]|nr:bifunctional sulfate adenylyltransferase/adenylylsulfate kinase [Chloracidobacterium sp.]